MILQKLEKTIILLPAIILEGGIYNGKKRWRISGWYAWEYE
jgi:hypothetical protein